MKHSYHRTPAWFEDAIVHEAMFRITLKEYFSFWNQNSPFLKTFDLTMPLDQILEHYGIIRPEGNRQRIFDFRDGPYPGLRFNPNDPSLTVTLGNDESLLSVGGLFNPGHGIAKQQVILCSPDSPADKPRITIVGLFRDISLSDPYIF